eukprot:3769372-Amphidinium_carterae.1
MGVLPPEDHGRLEYFIKFWKDRSDAPQWMADVCARLDAFSWNTLESSWHPWKSPGLTSASSPSAEQQHSASMPFGRRLVEISAPRSTTVFSSPCTVPPEKGLKVVLRSRSVDGIDQRKFQRNKSGDGADPSYIELLRQQEIELPGVLRELERCRRKENHWVWYVFPTEKEGLSD